MKSALRLTGLCALACSTVAALAAFNPSATASKAVAPVETKPAAKAPTQAAQATKLQAKFPPGPPPPAPLESGPQPGLRGGIYPTRVASAKPTGEAPTVRQIPLINGVDPTPASSPPGPSTQVSAAQAAPVVTPENRSGERAITSAKAPTECLPPGLRTVLQEVQGRFGPVTLVSTTALHTDNHSTGSTRHKMHTDCRAVDFKVQGDVQAVIVFLKTRTEIGGVNTYRNNGVIHIDYDERAAVAAKRP